MDKIDKILEDLKTLTNSETEIQNTIKNLRADLLSELESQNLKQYKNNSGTVAYVEKQSVKIKNKADVLYRLEQEGLNNYIETKKDISKSFEKDIKEGKLSYEGVEIETKEYPQIRFSK